MRKMICFVLLFLVGAGANIVHVPGRSGDIIVAPDLVSVGPNSHDLTTLQVEDNSVILSSTPLSDTTEVQDRNIANVICQLLHVPIINPNIAGELKIQKPFSTSSKANLLIVLDGLSVGELPSKADRANILSNSYSIKRTSFPSDTIADLTNFATGYGPEQHGIVHKSWMTSQGEAIAYRAKALSRVATVSDVVSQLHGGQSMVISASADFQMASAFGVHPLIRKNYPFGNIGSFYLDKQSNSMKSVYGDVEGLQLTKEKMDLVSQRYTVVNNRISIDGEDITLEQEELAFFAEIEFALTLLENAKNNAQTKSLIGDQFPDMITITFSSIKALKAKYGNSEKLTVLLTVLESTIHELTTTLTAAYAGRLGHQMIFLGQSSSTTENNNKQMKKIVLNAVHNSILSKESFDSYFPAIYLDHEADFSLVCTQLLNSMNVDGYKVYCFEKPEEWNSLHYFGARASNDTGDSDAAIFQITLWSSVLLILVIYAAIYSLFAMDVGADSLLYRLTTPRVR